MLVSLDSYQEARRQAREDQQSALEAERSRRLLPGWFYSNDDNAYAEQRGFFALRFGFALGAGVLAVAVLIVAIVLAIGKPLAEASCNQKGTAYGLPSDYRLLSDTCFVELPNGRQVDVSQVRVFEDGRIGAQP